MNQDLINQHLNAIAKKDIDVKKAIKLVGYPEPRIRPQGFETFLSTIVGQQISTHAASAILQRVRKLLPTMQPGELLELDQQALREAGLSARKVEYAQGLASAIVDGSFDPQALSVMSDQQAIDSITVLRGFGVWSAEIYLMFSLQREDIFPKDDLALQVGLQKLKQLAERPTPKQAQQLIEQWSPWRSAGSLFLWHYYRGAPT